MDMEVLGQNWLPPRLLYREYILEKLEELLREKAKTAIRGISGVGKTTLVKSALKNLGAEYTWIDCSSTRTYSSLIRRLRTRRGVVVIDDYTLAKRDARVRSLIKKVAHVVVIHPWTTFPELEEFTVLEMKPYNPQELYDIMADRVLYGRLNVDEESVKYIADTIGYPSGIGSAKIALQLLKLSLEHGGGEANIETTKEVIRMYYL